MNCYIKDYPRPQFIRKAWANLNGEWNFKFDDNNVGEQQGWFNSLETDTKILVPFSCETKMSGIGDESVHNNVWYQKTVFPPDFNCGHKRTIIHFEGSDYLTKLWINGNCVGQHNGGYARFSFDITDYIKAGDNNITVKVEDSLRDDQPRGKQRWMDHNYGCWYIQTTGIWKTVWLEFVNEEYIRGVKITPDLDTATVNLEFDVQSKNYDENLLLKTYVKFNGEIVGTCYTPVLYSEVFATINISERKTTRWKVLPWTPEGPNLYDLEFQLLRGDEICDEVLSYFGMRKISIQQDKVLLNNVPIYQRLILDQGYWSDSHLTPPSEEAIIKDIDKILALGYNGIRKHQKIEDERFLYWCDVKGVLVWSEMAAAYSFNDNAIDQFTKEWVEIVKQNYNHTCIITWVPFNESWGLHNIKTNLKQQNFTQAIYYLTKALDTNRPIIVNDGWEHTISDIITLHDYEEKGKILFDRYMNKDMILGDRIAFDKKKYAFADGFTYQGQPVIISEFGGIAFSNEQQGWGYGNKVVDKKAFIERFDEITTAIKKLPFVCGFCYTQVTDVQQEINGLMDIERNYKIEPEIIKEINIR